MAALGWTDRADRLARAHEWKADQWTLDQSQGCQLARVELIISM